MDIYERLEDDHGKQRGLMGAIGETTGDSDERRRLFSLLKKELAAHADAEEQIFYAEMISEPDAQDKARHSIVEHHDLNGLIAAIEAMDMSHGSWLEKFKELRHDVEHHLEEEEKDLFPLARKLISQPRADAMTAEFEERKSAEAKKVET